MQRLEEWKRVLAVMQTIMLAIMQAMAVGTLPAAGSSAAASQVIGVAMAKGSLSVDASRVVGNGTLFEGTTIETGQGSTDVKLVGGTKMTLAGGTRGRVYRDRLILERGELETGGVAGTYRILARSLQIDAEKTARVSLGGGNRVLVAALSGPVRISRSNGMLVATLVEGHSLTLEAQEAGASAPETMTGCVQKKNGHYYLTDEVAGVTVEISGAGLDKMVGRRVQMTGNLDPSAAPAAGALRVVRATNWKDLGKGCPTGLAGAAAGADAGGGSAAGTAGAAAGMAVATKAVIVGVVVAAAGTGTAVGLTRNDDAPATKPPISQ